jgi:signal transduction histidine kinase
MAFAAEAASLALWVWDVSRDEGWMTDRGRSMLGFKPGERIHYSAILDRVHPADRAERAQALRHAIETRGGYETEYRVQHPDLGLRWINARGRCEASDDGGGGGVKLFGVSVDVTERKRAEASAAQEREELQRKRAELEHVARVATLGELTATLTHELRQPLTAILANAALGIHLLDEAHPDLKELRETFCEINETTERAADVIQGLRGMLKRDTDGFADVDLNQLIRGVDRMLRGDAMTHRVKVRLDLAPGVMTIWGDGVHLQQVLLNLMLNAFGAMRASDPDGGRQLIVRTLPTDGGAAALLEVQDNGSGIAPDQLESIFQPFVTGKPDGLGMGLSICRSIIERHGGRVWATNNPDRGAKFSVTLPFTRPGAA